MTGVTPPPADTNARVVTAKDLPLSCPLPEDEVWNMHPRVYLPIDEEPSGELTCPYCGARYRLQQD
ncbi:zinc-finger domain-containing protein [Halochromatium sp.]